jgi:hypothetical protein
MQIVPLVAALNTGIQMRLKRGNPEVWYGGTDLGTLTTETKGDYNAGLYAILSMEYILDVNNISEYDVFTVEAQCGNPSFYSGDVTIWRIELIDIPENGVTGVISISDKTTLKLNDVIIIDGRE